ncbi:hypothetical protein MIND_01156400 [Mycena indigotica]|uniref:Uncharacterized protein n=1 Tax=Mycena indigotica TaxID=2126181 RepID=A0A8H6S4G9_9AGAR|nr:uncharacterized protein MIND_01156400 [Mycena indigotica]KAF7292588.1 hypothetical protein MIND_01156400 [Mycena indigotica]
MFSFSWWNKSVEPAIVGPPRLSEDLEREIFLLAAFQAPLKIVANHILVAKRTRLWLEPLLYRTILVLQYDRVRHQLEQRLRRKPGSVLRDGPRNLLIALGEEKEDVAYAEMLLLRCTGVQNLSFHPPLRHSRRFLPAMKGMTDLRRVCTQLQELFDGAIGSVDLQLLPFAKLTHLLLFDEMVNCSESDAAHLAQQLACLPALTHAAVSGKIPHYLPLAILSVSSLRILVNLRQDTRLRTVQMMYERELKDVNDIRFVIAPVDIWVREWEAATKGAPDFWAVAERFVEAKQSGAISSGSDKYWTDDDMTV